MARALPSLAWRETADDNEKIQLELEATALQYHMLVA
jgi:hypothetical protein